MLTFTKVQAVKPSVLSKSFALKDNKLVASPGGKLWEGKAIRMTLPTIREFSETLQSLTPNEALLFGAAQKTEITIYSKAALEKHKLKNEEGVARTRINFTWPKGPGIFMLDYDPYGATVFTREQLLERLYAAWPALRTAPHIWRPSVSSCLINMNTGEVLKPIRGQRVYVAVKNAEDIQRAGNNLYARLWLTGDGFLTLSKSGAVLDRNIIDASVWQPERLDFCGGARCEPPVKQSLPKPIVYNEFSSPIDTRLTLPELSNEQKSFLNQKKKESREKLNVPMKKTREKWIETRLSENPKIPRQVYEKAVSECLLNGDFVLHSEHGNLITVDTLLGNPEKYHALRFKDPLEPEYGNGNILAWVNLKVEKPYINSFAHGGIKYSLMGSEPVMKKYMEHFKKMTEEKNKGHKKDEMVSVRS